jgi:phosphoglycerate kinase
MCPVRPRPAESAPDEQPVPLSLPTFTRRTPPFKDSRLTSARRTIDQIDVRDLTVLVRVDFNVPLKNGAITDDTRIRAAIPTIQSILDRGGKVVLMSHLGRPEGTGYEAAFSLAPAAARLAEHLGRAVAFPSQDCIDDAAKAAIAAMNAGDVVLLENLRFHKAEKKGDAAFAAALAAGVDAYCNDAFGTAHRADASMVAVAEAMGDRPRVAGRLLEKELQYLGTAIESAERPFVAILGGAKVSDKLKTIRRLAGTVDALVVGGAMAFTLLKAKGHSVGKSLVEQDMVEEAGRMIEEVAAAGTDLVLPSDFVCATGIEAGLPTSVHGEDLPEDVMGLDIGPASSARFAEVVRSARTVVWNGPMGLFEVEPYDAGTRAVAAALVEATEAGATTIIGGGDTAAAIQGFGLGSKVSHVSTGGGASLTMLEGSPMPALDVLDPA